MPTSAPLDLLTAAEASRLLGVTPATVRMMHRRRELRATFVMAGGMRLFARKDVEQLLAKREARTARTRLDEEARG